MKRLIKMIVRMFCRLMPWRMRYFCEYSYVRKRIPNLFKPKDYSEYIFRDNLLGYHKKHTFLADKYEVRNYVDSKGLGNLLTRLYGVWDDAKKINFHELPNQFVLKCNHSCGMNIICFDKSELNIPAAVDQLNKWMKQTHPIYYEVHYKKIRPLIICEELIKSDANGVFPVDYKIHCAHGSPVYIQYCSDRSEFSAGQRIIYSPEWKNLHFIKQDYHYYSTEVIPCPPHLDVMLKSAAILSSELKYARIDFYDTDERVIFGEITLTPMGGWLSYFTQDALNLMGEAIQKGVKYAGKH